MKHFPLPLALAAAAVATPARADFYQSYDITYSGASFSNPAIAAGTLTLDLTDFGPDPSNVTGSIPVDANPLGYDYLAGFNLTVSGSTTGGNGTYTLADYSGFTYKFTSVNLTTQVVGQPGLNDFNFFSNDSAPKGIGPLTLSDAGGDNLVLTSLAPVPAPAPEPAQVLSGLMVAGLSGASLLVRRFRNRK